MSTRRPWAAVARSPDVDRSLGMLISLSAFVLILAEAARFAGQIDSFAPWWTAAGCTMVLLAVAAGVGGRILPGRALVALWTAFVVLLVGVEFSIFLAYRGADPDAVFPWAWRFESIAVCYLVLLTPPTVALVFPLLVAFLPAVSGLVFLGRVPEVVAAQTPLHLGNVVFAVLFVAMRSRLFALSQAEKSARAEEARRAMLDAHAEQEEQFTRMVHDELLSVFSAALHVAGSTPPVLRGEAAQALERLRGAVVVADDDAVTPGRSALGQIVATVTRVLPEARVVQEHDDTAVPTPALEAVRSALAEAARNAARHASGSPATLTVSVRAGRIDASVTDEGPGFTLDRVPLGRLGVRESILGRMHGLPGGGAHIETSPSGTRVVVTWHP